MDFLKKNEQMYYKIIWAKWTFNIWKRDKADPSNIFTIPSYLKDPQPQTHMHLQWSLWRGGNTPSYPQHSSSTSHASKLFLVSRLKGSCKAGLEKDGKVSENAKKLL